MSLLTVQVLTKHSAERDLCLVPTASVGKPT